MTRRVGAYTRTDYPSFNGRTREGALLKGIRADLLRHVGGNPDPAQRQIIEAIAHARIRLALMDQQLAETGKLADQTVYLGLLTNVGRLMARLDAAPPPPPPSLADIIGTTPAGTPARAPEAEDEDTDTDDAPGGAEPLAGFPEARS